MRKTLPTESDIIISHLQGELAYERLTSLQQQRLDRVQTCQSLLIQHKRTDKVVRMMVERYGYSTATAYRDLQMTGEVFGPVMKVHKQLLRAVAEKMIEEDRAVAKAKNDSRALAMCTKNFMDLHNLKDDDADLPDWSAIEWHQNIIMVLPEQVGINPRPVEELVELAKKMIYETAEVVEFTEQKDGEH